MEESIQAAVEQVQMAVLSFMAAGSWRKCYRAVLLELLKKKPDSNFDYHIKYAKLAADAENERALELSKEASEQVMEIMKTMNSMILGAIKERASVEAETLEAIKELRRKARGERP
jgi:hypothetical protein